MGFCVFREWQQCFFCLHVDGCWCVPIFWCRLWLPGGRCVLKSSGKIRVEENQASGMRRSVVGWRMSYNLCIYFADEGL